MGDFNAEPNEPAISDFCEISNTKNIIKEKTYFKNPKNPTCIDLILTNRLRSFQDSTVAETGLSDFHNVCNSDENVSLQAKAICDYLQKV